MLVSGASRGIGLSIARNFLQEGARVAITSRNYDELETIRQNLEQKFPAKKILSGRCDFSSHNDIVGLKKRIMDEWNGLDIVVANAGSGRSVPDIIPSQQHFDSTFNQNFTVAVNVAREFMPILELSRGGILFIASIAGIEAYGAPVDYSVAKSAVLSFSKNIARKVAHKGVRVNCIAPGNIWFEGGGWDEKLKAEPERIGNLIDTTVPMKRFGKPEEIADAALFLCSERASFITGAVLCVDGGQTVSLF